MLQFYLLSVLLNGLCGLVLFFSFDGPEKNAAFDNYGITRIDDPSLFENRTFRFVLGLLSIVVAALKLVVTAGSIPVFSDLLPVLSGIAGGTALLINFFITSSTVEIELPRMVDKVFVRGAHYIGIVCILTAIVHFTLPQVILL